jgi:cobalamin biosynthesis protein CobT
MLRDEAEELVETYGADQSRWPAEHVGAMRDLIQTDAGFQKFLKEAAQLDNMLSQWDDDDDGVTLGDSDGDDDEDEGDEDDDDFDGVEPTQTENEAPQVHDAPTEQDNDEAGGVGAPIEIDFDDLKDTDTALEEILRGMMRGGFDEHTQTHLTRDYDVIEPYKAPNHVDGVAEMETEVKSVAGTLQKDLQRIMVARAQSFFVPGFRSGRLNSPSLHRLKAGDNRVFRRKHIAETNKVAVSLLIDLSGSMKGAKVKTALMAAWAFSEVLDRLRIPNEVIGFTDATLPASVDGAAYQAQAHDFADATGLTFGSIRWYPMWMPVFKGYDEKFTQETKRRLTHMATKQKGMVANNDAAAIEFAGERLRRRAETRKIMLVFSDGQPAGMGVDDRILNQSLVTNIAKLEKQGMEIIGIGINDASVKRFYKKSAVIYKVSDLPKMIIGELKALLTK